MKVSLYLQVAAVMVFSSTVAAEQEPLEGQVVNPMSLPVQRAQVELYRLDDPTVRVTSITDENGAFSLPVRNLVPPPEDRLRQNHPNPFNPSTLIPFELSAGGHVRLDIYNILGQRVVTLIDGERPAGFQRVQWDGLDASGRGVAAGVYIYRLSTGDWNDARKLLLLDGASGRSGGSAVSYNEEARVHTFGVSISGEEIITRTYTWNPGAGPLVAEVTGIEDLLPAEEGAAESEANPFSGTSLASIIKVVSGR